MKKVLFLTLMMMMLFVGSVSAYTGGILDGATLKDKKGKYYTELTDNDPSTKVNLNSDVIIFELPNMVDVDKVYTLSGGSANGTAEIIFYDKLGLAIHRVFASKDGKVDVNVKDVRAIGIVGSRTQDIWLAEFDIFGTMKSTRPYGLSATSKTKAVELRWMMTETDDFVGYDVYRNDVKITPTPIQQQIYMDTTGEPDIVYRYKVSAVYKSGGDQFSDDVEGAAMQDMLPFPMLLAKAYHNRLDLSWNDVGAVQYKLYYGDVKLYDSDGFAYGHSGLEMDTEYAYTLEFVDKYGRSQIVKKTFRTTNDESDGELEVPSGLKVQPDVYDANLTWDVVNNPDLEGYKVFLNGSPVSGVIKESSYRVTSLKSKTEYKAYVISVDRFGKMSEPSEEIAFQTKELTAVPGTPVLTGKVLSASVLLSWTPAKYADSYKVFQDGKMIAETDSTEFRVRDLKNGTMYRFAVVAINAIGESSSSNAIELTPDASIVPDISLGYNLKDIADGTGSWFDSMWLLLAFVIAIPLSFYIGNRVKGLFA